LDDNGLDLVVLIFCIALLIPFGINAVIPFTYQTFNDAREVLGDKTIHTVEGAYVGDTFDNTVDIYEIILTLQVQDDCMQEPRLITVPNANCPSEKYHYYTKSECSKIKDAPVGAGCYLGGNSYSCKDSAMIDVTSVYKPDILNYSYELFDALNTSYVSDKYTLTYNYGRHGNQVNYTQASQESYRVQKVN
jgi:hypothetical protein